MLECILCGKIIIQNDKPFHYAVCTNCNVKDLNDRQKKVIEMGINYYPLNYSYEFLKDVYNVIHLDSLHDKIIIRYKEKQFDANKDLLEIINVVEKCNDGLHVFAERLEYKGIILNNKEVYDLFMGS